MTTTSAAPVSSRTKHGGKRASLSRWAERHLRELFILPSVLFVLLMIVFPLIYTINLSLTDARRSTSRPNEYIWGANYAELLSDFERFWPSVGRTFGFTLTALAIEAVIGLTIALLLRKPFRGQGLVRVIILLPLVATPVAVGMMWKLMFEPTIGFANTFVGWFGIPAQGWLSDPSQTLGTLIFIDVWQWTPMIALILLAGLSTLPEEPDEAARVDGANAWQRFRFITMPLLMPALISAITLRAIDALKTFDIIYATMGRGGGSSHEAETLNILAYSYSFDYTEYGLASAVLVLFLLIICAVIASLVLLRRTRKV
jgi:multiple sugar transport system permease protein